MKEAERLQIWWGKGPATYWLVGLADDSIVWAEPVTRDLALALYRLNAVEWPYPAKIYYPRKNRRQPMVPLAQEKDDGAKKNPLPSVADAAEL